MICLHHGIAIAACLMTARKTIVHRRLAPARRLSRAAAIAGLIVVGLLIVPDMAAAQADLDLSLRTRVVSNACLAGDSCTFAVAITNFGPDVFDGTLRLRGRFRQRIRVPLTSIGPAGWSCNQSTGGTVCTHDARGLRPGRSLLLETTYELPAGIASYELEYCTEIEWEPTAARGREPTVADIQRALAARGYNPGPVDGVPGFGTRNAIAAFQADNGLEPTGWPSPEFIERLFSGAAGIGGDNDSANDRDCTSTSEMPPPPGQPGQTDALEPWRTRQQPATPDTDIGPPPPPPSSPAPLPTVRTPLPTQHGKTLSTFHETYRSGLHDTVLSRSRSDEPAGQAAEPEQELSPQLQAEETLAPVHGKLTSEFHRKQLSTQHDKATSGAIVETKPLAPITGGEQPAEGKDAWKKEFHQKYKSVQHDKETTTLQKVHTKAISRVVHSKARSVITDPQFQGNIHDKAMSDFHRKFVSSSHDAATSQARSGQ